MPDGRGYRTRKAPAPTEDVSINRPVLNILKGRAAASPSSAKQIRGLHPSCGRALGSASGDSECLAVGHRPPRIAGYMWTCIQADQVHWLFCVPTLSHGSRCRLGKILPSGHIENRIGDVARPRFHGAHLAMAMRFLALRLRSLLWRRTLSRSLAMAWLSALSAEGT